MKKGGRVHEINPRRERQQRLRRILVRCVRSALSGEVAGFALVTWDALGNAHSSYCTESGPVGHGLMPAYVHDALNRHVAVMLAQEACTSQIDDN